MNWLQKIVTDKIIYCSFCKEKKAVDVARGKKAEKNYAKLYTNVEWPTEMQDIKEHWDVKVEGYKIDVKAIKKDDENIHFVEFKNVQGKKGWLYGDADGFAFETKDYWVEVKKEKLQDWIHEKCVDKVMGWNVMNYLVGLVLKICLPKSLQ